MPDLTALGLPAALALFLAASLLVLGAGVHLTRLADRLADMTGWGEAIVGGVILGAVTSLSGGVTSVSAAAGGHAELAVSNAVGGIAAQTVFLVAADWSYRRVNLEHAAASLPNMINGVTLIAMLAIPLLARQVAPATFWGIHPASFLLFAVYAGSIALARRSREQPMWRPVRTAETVEDEPDESSSGASVGSLDVAAGPPKTTPLPSLEAIYASYATRGDGSIVFGDDEMGFGPHHVTHPLTREGLARRSREKNPRVGRP